MLGETGNAGKLAVTRGPVVLTLDQAVLPANAGPFKALTVADEDAAKLTVQVAPAGDDYSRGAVFTVPGMVHAPGGQAFDLRLTDFAHAGANRERYEVWMPRPSAAPAAAASGFTTERWSREGNVEGSILDGDPETFRVTYDGGKRDEDWFEGSSEQPAPVGKVVFVQGKLFHDGGWWDGQPRIEYRATADGPWQLAGTLDAYPATTATDAKGVSQGQRFELKLATPVKAVAVRVIGKPACGDSAAQSFASCADLLVSAQ